MNIDPTTAAGPMPDTTTGQQPAAADIQAFMAAMSARAPKPEAIATEAIRKADAKILAPVQSISPASAVDPTTMTRTQQALLEMRTSVDLIAKIAGTLSQSINKLTTMQ